jgi:uncharacterized protein
MEIRDVLYGAISIEPHERPVLDSFFFQRLRQIKQLGFAEFSYPSAVHNRYVHSLGAMKVASRAFEVLFGQNLLRTSPQTYFSFRALTRLAAMLHDIGHGPLSHTTEFAMPDLADLKLDLPHLRGKKRQATHEDYTLKMILDSEFTRILERASEAFGFKPIHIAALIDPEIQVNDDFFWEPFQGTSSVNFRPILQQLISSELDADRMDYLRRDSFHAGVSYGQYDHDWLISNLGFHLKSDEAGKTNCYLALGHRALYAFEDFLLSRSHMFLMVYFHYKSVIYDEMLMKYFETAPKEYTLPANIVEYCGVHDAHLYAALAKSKNEWAQRITEKRTYSMLFEMHSGIPFRAESRARAQAQYLALKEKLKTRGIDALETHSEGELSKYYRKPGLPIFVHYNNQFHPEEFIPLEECTDLFQKYEEKRSITRLYVAPERLDEARK